MSEYNEFDLRLDSLEVALVRVRIRVRIEELEGMLGRIKAVQGSESASAMLLEEQLDIYRPLFEKLRVKNLTRA